MIVLDANILIRAVLGKRVRFLIEPYSSRRVRVLTPVTAFQEARKYLPTILRKRGISDSDVLPTLQYLQLMIESVDREVYERFEGEARERLRGRDEHDWPLVASSLLFGTGIPVWTTNRVEIFLRTKL